LEKVKKDKNKDDILGLKENKKGFKRTIKKVVLILVTKKLEQFLILKKVIIYSNNVNGIDSLGVVLKCKVYY
jgi:hypothetical protein